MACIYRLSKEQRRQLRAHVESEEAERPLSDAVTDKYWQQLLHRERRRRQPPEKVYSGLKRSAAVTPEAWKMWKPNAERRSGGLEYPGATLDAYSIRGTPVKDVIQWEGGNLALMGVLPVDTFRAFMFGEDRAPVCEGEAPSACFDRAPLEASPNDV